MSTTSSLSDDSDDILALLNPAASISSRSSVFSRNIPISSSNANQSHPKLLNHHFKKDKPINHPFIDSSKTCDDIREIPENVFLDENGIPTDAFLESFKADIHNDSESDEYDSLQHFHNFQQVRPVDHFDHNGRVSQDNHKLLKETSNNRILKVKRRSKGIQTVKVIERTDAIQQFPENESADEDLTDVDFHNFLEPTNVNVKSKKPTYRKLKTKGNTNEKSKVMNNKVVREQLVNFSLQQNDSNNIESDCKIKSLELRLKGQIQTIKTLETQLQESINILRIKDRECQTLQSKVDSLEKKFQHFQLQNVVSSSSTNIESMSSLLKHTEERLKRSKQQIESFKVKANEEQSKRIRVEERIKVYKDYVEKTKTKNQELEKSLSEQQQVLSELQLKFMKIKKDARESSSDLIAHKEELAKKEIEINNIRLKNEKLESRCESLQFTNKRLETENKSQKSELQSLQEAYKRCLKDIESWKEKYQHLSKTLEYKSRIHNSNSTTELQSTPQTNSIAVTRHETEASSSTDNESSFDYQQQYLHYVQNKRRNNTSPSLRDRLLNGEVKLKDSNKKLSCDNRKSKPVAVRSRSLSPHLQTTTSNSNTSNDLSTIRNSISHLSRSYDRPPLQTDLTSIGKSNYRSRDQLTDDSESSLSFESSASNTLNQLVKDRYSKIKNIYERVVGKRGSVASDLSSLMNE